MTAHIRDKKTEIGEELADVFYWVLLLANKMDINLVVAFSDKMAKIEGKYTVVSA